MIEGVGEGLGGLTLAVFYKKIKSISIAYAIGGLIFLIALVIFYLGL